MSIPSISDKHSQQDDSVQQANLFKQGKILMNKKTTLFCLPYNIAENMTIFFYMKDNEKKKEEKKKNMNYKCTKLFRKKTYLPL